VARPHPIQDHAIDNLRYIRDTMERAANLTAVPGYGGMVMGGTALVAAALASQTSTNREWLAIWLTELVLAVAIGSLAMIFKARQIGTSLLSEAGRKFLLSFTPAVAVGAVLTAPLYLAGQVNLLGAVWLLCYGAAVIGGGSFSAKIVPAMGIAFLALGVLALVTPPTLRDLPLAAGFGGLHLIFGYWIARKYGG
jgi:hypothetical protein